MLPDTATEETFSFRHFSCYVSNEIEKGEVFMLLAAFT